MFGFKNYMQISSIKSSFLPQRIQNINSSTPFIQKSNNQGDIFVSFKRNDYPKRILQDKMKFGISDYMKLSTKEIEDIRKNKYNVLLNITEENLNNDKKDIYNLYKANLELIKALLDENEN